MNFKEKENKESPTPIEQIGAYRIIECLAKGGMGQVYRAFDQNCEREVALKSIRTDLEDRKSLQENFLLEAKITSQLSHPSIIPVYSIVCEKKRLYYTMPFVEGDTLRQVLRQTRTEEKAGKKAKKGSIQTLCRSFLQICQGIAYAHSQSVIHGDIKPENIILGKYGQVLILDWGLAELMKAKKVEKKAMGTLSYLAPERALGQAPSVLSDVYSLGVILYQMLTLHFPFRRKSLEEFRQNYWKEEFPNPNQVAPYRDVPRILAQISRKCLQKDPSRRYASVDELIDALKIFLEGRSDWFFVAKLDPKIKEQWCFDANLLLENNTISGISERSYWAHWMLAKESFSDKLKICARFRLKEQSLGLGFALCANEEDFGYLMRLSDESCLYRSNVELLRAESLCIKDQDWHELRIEKSGNKIEIQIDDREALSFLSYLPSSGKKVGLLARDSCYEIVDFQVFSAGPQTKVSCLAVADAFLAEKQFQRALEEFRRISQSFPDRYEGREAMFKAGICLLESAKETEEKTLLESAWLEFEKLGSSTAAPMEYLGKSLIHKALLEEDLEANCLELACRKYKKHPMLNSIEEQIIYRLTQCLKKSRYGTYRFALLAMQQLSCEEKRQVFQNFRTAIEGNWEQPYFLQKADTKEKQDTLFIITLCFWLAKAANIVESLEMLFKQELFDACLIENAAFSLVEIGAKEELLELFEQWGSKFPKNTQKLLQSIIEEKALVADERLFSYLCRQSIEEETSLKWHERSKNRTLFEIYWQLLESNFDQAAKLLESFSLEEICREDNLLHFLYICCLRAKEGQEIASAVYSGVLASPFPRSHSLACHYLFASKEWLKRAFPWEKKQLYQQLRLYYHCAGNKALSESYRLKAKEIFNPGF